jgi:hypothetical protein
MISFHHQKTIFDGFESFSAGAIYKETVQVENFQKFLAINHQHVGSDFRLVACRFRPLSAGSDPGLREPTGQSIPEGAAVLQSHHLHFLPDQQRCVHF